MRRKVKDMMRWGLEEEEDAVDISGGRFLLEEGEELVSDDEEEIDFDPENN